MDTTHCISLVEIRADWGWKEGKWRWLAGRAHLVTVDNRNTK